LYHHFPNGKEAMATAVLNYLNQGLTEQLLAPLQSDHPPEERLRALTRNVDEFYAQGNQACLLALLSAGEAHDLFAAQVQSALNLWIAQGNQACLLALLSAGEAHDLFAAQVQSALNLWIAQLAAVAIEAGISPKVARERAEDAVIQIQGALVLTRGMNDTAIFKRVLNQLPAMLLARSERTRAASG